MTPIPQMTESDLARFWAKVNKNGPVPAHAPELGPCWVWTAAKNRKNYGQFRVGGVLMITHRLSFCMTYGRWPEPLGMHRCDNPCCMRPNHITEGDTLANVADRNAKGRQAVGKRNARSKLTEGQVRAIREALRAGKTTSATARSFGVTFRTVANITNGLTWRNVE